jgi:hypothetical protein
MKLDFRCDKCGKMLKLEADPGRRIRCPNCRGWAKVPALLGQLPHPHIPPDANADPVPIAVKDELEEASPVALAAIGAGMPWVISAIMHVGVFLIMLFIVMISTRLPRVDTGSTFTIDPRPDEVIGKFKDPAGSSQAAAQRRLVKSHNRPRDMTISQGPGDSKVDITYTGVGSSVTGKDIRDGKNPGGGFYGLKGPGEGGVGARNVVYVVDRSGSMAKTFEEVKGEMLRSISRLDPNQRFHVVLFGEGKTVEGPRRVLVNASLENKVAAVYFLSEKQASGATTALVALQRAFAVLATRPANESKLIYFLSDGDFSGLSGGSQYRASDGRTLDGNEAVLQWLADNNKGPKVYIHTVLLHSSDESAVKVLKAIAQSNGGRFKYISPDE